MDQNTLFTIVILFLLSKHLWNIFWDIGKSLFYIVCIVIGLNVINPELSLQLQNYIEKIITLDTSILSSSSKFILNIFDSLGLKQLFNYKTEAEYQNELATIN